MNDINPIHLSLKRKIKKSRRKNTWIKKKELKALQEKYTGKIGRIPKSDKKKDNTRMKELKKEISMRKPKYEKPKNK